MDSLAPWGWTVGQPSNARSRATSAPIIPSTVLPAQAPSPLARSFSHAPSPHSTAASARAGSADDAYGSWVQPGEPSILEHLTNTPDTGTLPLTSNTFEPQPGWDPRRLPTFADPETLFQVPSLGLAAEEQPDPTPLGAGDPRGRTRPRSVAWTFAPRHLHLADHHHHHHQLWRLRGIAGYGARR